LPFYDLAALTDLAIKYKFKDPAEDPARIKAAKYMEEMRPYLMLAKNPGDKIATENLMKSRFWNYLGMQVRQPFEAMLIQNGTDPYKLDMDGLVEALKAYSHVIGGEVYARPDAAESYAVLSISVKEDKKEKVEKVNENAEEKTSKNLGQGKNYKKEFKTNEESSKKSENRGPYNSSPMSKDSYERRNFGSNRGRGSFQNRGSWRNSNYGTAPRQVAAIAQQPHAEMPVVMPPMMTPYYPLTQPMNMIAAQTAAYPTPNNSPIVATPNKTDNSSPEKKGTEIPPPNNYQKRNNFNGNRGRGNGNRGGYQRNDRRNDRPNEGWKRNQDISIIIIGKTIEIQIEIRETKISRIKIKIREILQ